MPGTITIVTSEQPKFNCQVKATTIGGRYTVGDTRTKPTGYIKIVNNDIEKWQAGFDKIDIAPKDGELSLEEICAYRDKQVQRYKFAFWINSKHWLNFEKQIDFKSKIKAEERITEKYRRN
jgi:hypothetical protein